MATIIPLTDTAAVAHLAAAHGDTVTSLLAKSPDELEEAWKVVKRMKRKAKGDNRNSTQGRNN